MRSSKWADHRTDWKRDKGIDRNEREPRGYSSRDYNRKQSRSRSPGKRTGSPPGPIQPEQIEKPNYRQSGLLVKESKKTTTGKILKYHELEDSTSPPKGKYRLYQFDAQGEVEDVFKLDQRSSYLIGRDESLAHIPLNADAASSQHAVLQFRLKINTNKYGDKEEEIKLYMIDLESRNGTKLNGKNVPESRYVELMSGDVLNFGGSEDYVVMVDE